ncbi:superoxide dismutase family protein [Afifella pfennigii]|uniref:superoxide dismutase family protein n=1 Tax=Afifella pfennigii TaxID=209897 RepID=UPI00047C1A47|nr:superoxide dismutase family protein [Afifella pfennigii]
MRTIAIAAFALLAGPALAQDAATFQGYTQSLQGAEGEVGQIELTDTPQGVLVHVVIEEGALQPGVHALHFHETGDCSDAPDFQAAGGHYNPTGAAHGILAEGGMHAGDMPNFTVVEGQRTNLDVFNTRVRFVEGDAPLMDADGSALMIHSGADDYRSQPSGDAGSRVACAPITSN